MEHRMSLLDSIYSKVSDIHANTKQLGEWQLCPKCTGWGKVQGDFWDGITYVNELTCPVCNGAKVLARPIINDKNV